MDIDNLPKDLRIALYKSDNIDDILSEFKSITTSYGIESNVCAMENEKHIILEVKDIIQFIRSKNKPLRIHAIVPLDSPLNKGPVRCYDACNKKYVDNRR